MKPTVGDAIAKFGKAAKAVNADRLLAELGRKPEMIIRLRYDIGIDEPQTLKEIGLLLDVTRKRIRQIESKALTKLKHPTRKSKLSCWSLDDEASTNTMAEESDDDDTKAVAPPKPPPAVPRPAINNKPVKPDSGKRLSAIERILREATLLDIPVEQNVCGEETTTWVSVTKPADTRERELVRSLNAVGFEYWLGKEYCR